MRARRSGLTFCGEFSARDTLAVETPARRATSTKRALPRASPDGRRDVRMFFSQYAISSPPSDACFRFFTLLRRRSVVNANEWR
jgi:hypothetical protein